MGQIYYYCLSSYQLIYFAGSLVPQLASEYGISTKTIYNWLSAGVQSEVSTLEHARLKRERDDLLRLVGNLTLEVEKRKKKRGY